MGLIPELVVLFCRKSRITAARPRLSGPPTVPPKQLFAGQLAIMAGKLSKGGGIRQFDEWNTVSFIQDEEELPLDCDWPDINSSKTLYVVSTDGSVSAGVLVSIAKMQNGPKLEDSQLSGSGSPRRVFIVHGRQDGPLHGVARLIQQLGLDPIVLREQPNRGRTIIEKFTDYCDVGFAVVLLLADDRGCLAAEPSKLKPRARQNVIMELGFFLGLLGRERVCVLCEEGVEIPSDYAGVLFVALDNRGAWRIQLAKEMREVGLQVDLNAL